MKNQPVSKELLKRKLEKLDDWRTSLEDEVLPQIWAEFVQKLCGRDANRFFENIVRPPKRFADSMSNEACEYRAKLRAENQAEIENQTGPYIDWLITRLESVWSDAPLVLRTEMEEARKRFEPEAVKKWLTDPIEQWSVREASDYMPERVSQARRLFFVNVMNVVNAIEAGLTESLSFQPQRVAGHTTREVRTRIRELDRSNPAATREELLQIAKDDPVIKKLGFGNTLNMNRLQHALSARSKKRDRKARDGDA